MGETLPKRAFKAGLLREILEYNEKSGHSGTVRDFEAEPLTDEEEEGDDEQ